ncbi:MAG: ester cyclase [Dehalococcoidia bacterium]
MITEPDVANTAVLRRYFEICNAHDYDAFADVLTQGHVFRGVLQGLEQFGAEAFMDVFRGYVKVFPDMRMEVEHLFAGQGYGAARVIHRGTHLGEGWPVPPTGRRVEFPLHLHARFEDGRIAEVWEQWDRTAVRAQLTGEA